MMIKKIRLLIVLPFLIFLLGGCEKEGFLDYENIDNGAEILFPILNTSASAEQLSTLENIEFETLRFTLEDQPFGDVSLPIPAITIPTVGPLELVNENGVFLNMKVDEISLVINMVNNFPINIKAGTILSFRNRNINNNEVFRSVLTQDIPAKGGTGLITITGGDPTQLIDNEIDLFILNFNTDGTSTVEDFDTFNNLELDLKIEVIQLNEATLLGNSSFSAVDTVAFELGEGGDDDVFLTDQIIINLLIENNLPLNYALEVSFLDGSFNLVRKLFESETISNPDIDDTGRVILETVIRKKISEEININEFNDIRDRTQYISYNLSGGTPSQNVVITKDNTMNLQITIESDLDF